MILKEYIQMITESEITTGTSMVGSNGTKYQIGNSYIDIQHSNLNFAPRSQSVIDFVVPESDRNKGIGKKLLAHAMKRHSDLGAQVSSPASVKVFHSAGFRNPSIPEGSFDDHEKMRHDDSSVFMAHRDVHGTKFI